jgi:hypothetical protein
MTQWCTSSSGDEVAVFSRWHKNNTGIYLFSNQWYQDDQCAIAKLMNV